MIELTEEMLRLVNNARESGYPCIVATASPDGVPNCGYIGTVLAIDGSTFVYRDRSGRVPLDHIEENTRVIVLFRHTDLDTGWKFRCTATVHREGEVFEDTSRQLLESGLVTEQYMADGRGVMVVLRIDQVLTLFGEVMQEREPGLVW